jgi:hypothetical protein
MQASRGGGPAGAKISQVLELVPGNAGILNGAVFLTASKAHLGGRRFRRKTVIFKTIGIRENLKKALTL